MIDDAFKTQKTLYPLRPSLEDPSVLAEQDSDDLTLITGSLTNGAIGTLEASKIATGTQDEIRFFVGYAGWHPKQLDREISENSWILSHTTSAEVMTAQPEQLWQNYLKNMGKDYAIWANYPSDPALN